MAEIPGIGSQPTEELRRVKEEYPLPGKRSELLKAVESILAKGGVQKFVLQLGRPIIVERLVKGDTVGPDAEILDDDIYFAARNAPMVEVETAAEPFRALYFAFARATTSKVVPKAILVKTVRDIIQWLSVPQMSEVFGVPVSEHKDIPDDVMLLVCTKPEEPDVVAMSFKILMEE